MSWVPKSEKRKSRPTEWFGNMASEERILRSDSGIDSLPLAVDKADLEDFDWVANVPGRPSPYPVTWNLVYVSRKPDGMGGFDVPCQEAGDGTIKLNGQFQELGASSTPHGQLRKPPVCHVIPWVLLSVALDEYAHTAGKTLTDEFRRYVCWGDVSNLRTGHNGCNAGGAKTTVANATASQKGQASAFVTRCANGYKGMKFTT